MEKVLARVGGVEITEADVTDFLAGLGQRGAAYNNPEGRKAVLNQIISNKLFLLLFLQVCHNAAIEGFEIQRNDNQVLRLLLLELLYLIQTATVLCAELAVFLPQKAVLSL